MFAYAVWIPCQFLLQAALLKRPAEGQWVVVKLLFELVQEGEEKLLKAKTACLGTSLKNWSGFKA